MSRRCSPVAWPVLERLRYSRLLEILDEDPHDCASVAKEAEALNRAARRLMVRPLLKASPNGGMSPPQKTGNQALQIERRH